MTARTFGAWLIVASGAVGCTASAEPSGSVLDFYAEAARASDAAFSGFSAQRGETLFRSNFSGGKPDTPSCTTCHTADPRKPGETRAGKEIDPMAASVNPNRYTDEEKTEKWFGRNCRNVLGRECTATEKGDFIAFMLSQ
jgi:hypothetical protein